MTHLAIQFAAFPRKGRVEDGAVDGPSTLMRMVGEELGMETQGMQAGQENCEGKGRRKGCPTEQMLQNCIASRTRISKTAGICWLGISGWG